MDTLVRFPETKVDISSTKVTQLQEVAETIREDALVLARSKLPRFQRDQDLEILFQHRDFLERFKCGLAKGIGDTLAAHDEQVSALYLFNPSANPDAESGEEIQLDATLHLLLLVNTPTAAMAAFIASLDRALTQCVKELPLPLSPKCDSILDVIPITTEDVKKRRGYAALLSSIFAPPLKICQRE